MKVVCQNCYAVLAFVIAGFPQHAFAEDSGTKIDAAAALQAGSMAEYQQTVAPFFVKHCRACHNATTAEKDLDLSKLEPDMKASTSAARWAVVLEQLSGGKMPPKAELRPSDEALLAVTTWIQAEMKRAGKHVARREAYANGNTIEHALLFDPQRIAKFDTPAGVRRLSPEIYTAYTSELGKGLTGLGQPFSAVGKTTFRDMGTPKLDEPTTAQLIRNALLIVEQKWTAHKIENGEIKATQNAPKQFLRLLDDANPPTDVEIKAAIHQAFDLALRRSPSQTELERFVALLDKNVKEAGRVTGARYTLATVLLLPEALLRSEHGAGLANEQGSVRLTPREIAFALSYALTDRRPESWLLAMADQQQLDDEPGVASAVHRMLADPKLDKPRIKRFFREYFQYDQAEVVFKDNEENAEHDAQVLIEDTDRLIQHILEQDRRVLYELLTTNKSFVAYKTAAETKKKRADELAKFGEKKQADPKKYETKKPPKVGRSVYESYNLPDFPDQQPVELPAEERAGILTQPSWLVAFSKSDENHAILRGKWIRERLLGGVVPDIPITVDAQLPIAPEKTLRERMAVTQEQYCWQCHKLMNRVGYPFERYDHFGRFRTSEPVLDREATAKNLDAKGKHRGNILRALPADASGGVEFVGDKQLEGDVPHAVALMHHLAASERVEQVFVRHAFRYWLGRNETLGDAKSLQAAHQAYKNSDGSMQSLITALLTSESFLYRVPAAQETGVEIKKP